MLRRAGQSGGAGRRPDHALHKQWGRRRAGPVPEADARFAEPIFAAFAQPAAVTTEADVVEALYCAANEVSGQL
jgi:hypothetical protein